MSHFMDRFKPGQDPMEPATPAPFAIDQHVRVVAAKDDDMFTGGMRGVVVDIAFVPDSEAFGPWEIDVQVDGMPKPLTFAADELAADVDVDQAIPYTLAGQIGPDREQLGKHEPYRRQASGEARAQEILFSEAVEVALPRWTAKFSGGAA